ncbi:MAG: ATPase, partial [Lachnospiraceae bacterium]|nr:ATPase [Lachnospiraceae bacterium]
MKEITYDELIGLPKDSFELIDIRDDGLTAYGMIPGARHIYVDDLENNPELRSVSTDKKLVFYCEIGRRSSEIDDTSEILRNYDCYSLERGYVGYVRSRVSSDIDKEEKRKKAELSIQKKFHKQLFSPFARACKTYKLIEEGDHIAVCISG